MNFDPANKIFLKEKKAAMPLSIKSPKSVKTEENG